MGRLQQVVEIGGILLMNGISPNRINKALQKLKEAEKELTDALAEAERPTPEVRRVCPL